MGKGTSNTTTQTTGLDPASQQFVDQSRAGAQAGADVALNAPGNFFLGADPRSVQEIIQPFMDPFQEQVIGGVRGEFDELRRRAVSGAGGTNQAAATAGAFGGSRQGVAQGVRLGELDRAQTSQISGLLSQNFQQAVQAGIPFSERQRALAQQQAQEPLFRQQQAQNFMNFGLGPTGQTRTTTQETEGNLFRDIVGTGLTVAGGIFGGPPGAALGSAIGGGLPGGGGSAGIIPEDIFAGQRFGGQF